jgi:integrase
MSDPSPPAAADVDRIVEKVLQGADYLEVTLDAVHQRLGELVAGEPPASPPPTSPPPASSGAVPSLRAYADELEQALRGQQSETLRTYRTGWRLLTDGVRLADVTSRGRHRWDEERERAWLTHAAALDAELDLGFAISSNPADHQREADTGVLVLWAGHGELPLDALTTTRFVIACSWARLRALTEARRRDAHRRQAGRSRCGWTGDGAVETLITATRRLYKHAVADGLVLAERNPTATVDKPRRGRGTRGTIQPEQLHDVAVTFATTGNDPELDRLLFVFHLLTGARQEGAWRLKLRHLDDELQAIAIPDKASPTKHGADVIDDRVPVPAWLLTELRALAHRRGSVHPDDPVFRYRNRHRNGEPFPPLTRRRYNTIYQRIRRAHPWAAKDGFGVHHLRHHVAAELEALGGRPVKMRFLRHAPNGQTDGYGKAGFRHLAWAIATWTEEPHPLALRPHWIDERRTAEPLRLVQ